MSELSTAPRPSRWSASRCRTRARTCTSPAWPCTPTTCSPATRARCTPTRCRPRTRTRRSGRWTPRPRWPCPGWCTCSPRPTCPGSTTPGSSTTSRCSRTRSVLRAPGVLGARRDATRRPGSAPRRSPSTTTRCRRWSRSTRPSPRRASRAPARRCAAATRRRRSRAARTSSRASSSSPARSTSTWRPTPRWPASTRTGRSSSSPRTQHPTETQDIVAHVLGRAVPRGHRAVPADGRRLRRQGDAAARLRRGRRARRDDHRPAGAGALHPQPGHHHHRQAARLPLHVEGRLRRRRPHPGADRHADRGRRLEPGPVRAGAGPGAVPHRQRLLDPEHRGARADLEDQQDLADRVPRVRRAAGHDRHREHPRLLRARARAVAPASCAGATSTRPARPRRTGRRCGTRSGIERAWEPGARDRRRGPAAGRDRGVQRRPRAHQAGAGHHPGQVRHLVQPDRVQPGRRAGARVQGRLGADQPRRHRDGPGPAHQDAAGRGDRARGAAVDRAAGADPHRQGAQHLGHRGQLRRRPQRRRGEERLRADQDPAGRGGRGRARGAPGRRAVRRRHGHRAGRDRQAS